MQFTRLSLGTVRKRRVLRGVLMLTTIVCGELARQDKLEIYFSSGLNSIVLILQAIVLWHRDLKCFSVRASSTTEFIQYVKPCLIPPTSIYHDPRTLCTKTLRRRTIYKPLVSTPILRPIEYHNIPTAHASSVTCVCETGVKIPTATTLLIQ